MTERDMVMDILCGVKASISNYAKSITECCNLNLRQTYQQMRNGDEQFQYDLYKIAEQKGYYIQAPQASSNECQELKTKLTQVSTSQQGAGPIPVIK